MDIYRYPEQKLFTMEACEQRYREWLQRLMRKYKYRSKKAMMQNMQSVYVDQDDEFFKLFPSNHDQIEGWGWSEENFTTVSADSSAKIIGAAAKYAIGSCQGRGADIIRNLLFPNGLPKTFEEYVESIEVP